MREIKYCSFPLYMVDNSKEKTRENQYPCKLINTKISFLIQKKDKFGNPNSFHKRKFSMLILIPSISGQNVTNVIYWSTLCKPSEFLRLVLSMLFNTYISIPTHSSLLLADNIYRNTPKDPKLAKIINSNSRANSITSDMITMSAKLLVGQWERNELGKMTFSNYIDTNENRSSVDHSYNGNSNGNGVYYNLVLFMSKLIMNTKSTSLVLLASLYYSHKIYKMYSGKISSGHGCSFRVFTISLMIACKYLLNTQEKREERDENDNGGIGNDYQYWAACTLDMFNARDIERMESEMLSFLKYDIQVTMADLQWFKECIFDSNSISIVPDSNSNGSNWINY